MHGCYNQWDVTKSMIFTLFTQQTVSTVSIPAHRNIYTTIQCQYPQMMWSSLDISTVNPRYLRPPTYSFALIYQFFFPPTVQHSIGIENWREAFRKCSKPVCWMGKSKKSHYLICHSPLDDCYYELVVFISGGDESVC